MGGGDGAAGGSTSSADSTGGDDDESKVANICQMGFTANAARRALAALGAGGGGVQEAMMWLLDHAGDAGMNDPLPGEEEPFKVDHLVSKGYTRAQAVEALKSTGGDLPRSFDFLLSRHGDPTAEAEAACAAAAAGESAAAATSSKYSLVAFINHAGKSASSGHYIAHVKRDGQWLKFNDRVVVTGHPESGQGGVPPLETAYMYFYVREA